VNPAPLAPAPAAAFTAPPGTGCFSAFAGDEGGAITGDGVPAGVSGFFSLGDNWGEPVCRDAGGGGTVGVEVDAVLDPT